MRDASDPIWKQQWYYKIEVLPNVITNGFGFPSIAVVRQLLSKIRLKGQDCIDIGAMESMVSILVERNGGNALAWDRHPDGTNATAARLQALRDTLGVKLPFVRGTSLRDIQKDVGRAKFDVVVFAGVLYHVFDPFACLLRARSMLRDGGIMIIETAATDMPDITMSFNARGRFYPRPEQGNYWLPSAACLHYLCRCARLRPVDCCYLHDGVLRLGLACRAESSFGNDDKWLAGQNSPGAVQMNYDEAVDWSTTASDKPFVDYNGVNVPLAAYQILNEQFEIKDLKKILRLGDKE